MRAYSLSHWHPEPESAETLSQGRPKEAAECLGLLRPAQAARDPRTVAHDALPLPARG